MEANLALSCWDWGGGRLWEKAPEILEETIKCPEILNNFSEGCLPVYILLHIIFKLHNSTNEVHFLSH